jgi:predicted phosphate transport protein (TIGR00153 family)
MNGIDSCKPDHYPNKTEGVLGFSFLPAEVKFYDYFEQASANLLDGARLLQNLLDDYQNLEEVVGQITEVEHRGDFIVHEVTNLLPRTLITPIDGDDIQRLISSVDDALDAVHAVAQRLLIYRVDDVRKPARRLAHLIVESAQELDAAIHCIRDKKKYDEVRNRIVQINTLENNGDRVFYDGLTALVSHRDDIFDFIRWKEIYELLEATTDRIEDAADVMQRVMIANA